MIKVGIYQDTVHEDGCIYSGPKVDSFKVTAVNDILSILEAEYPDSNWNACSDGSDGAYENSEGYGTCLVSMVETT